MVILLTNQAVFVNNAKALSSQLLLLVHYLKVKPVQNATVCTNAQFVAMDIT